MDVRCVKCNRLLLIFKINEVSEQDFNLEVVCQKCGHRNEAHIIFKRAPVSAIVIKL